MNDIVLMREGMVQAFSTQPIMYCKQISQAVSSIREVFDAPDVQLSDLNRVCSVKLYSVLTKFIEGMLLFYGRTRDDMSDLQVKLVIDDIVRKYYYFRIEDVCLCFKMARTNSAYKDFYGRIDGSVIMSWFATYDKERDEVIHTIPERKSVVYSGDEISREEWEEVRLAMAAGGDMDAYAACIASEMRERWMQANRVVFGNYKYHRKHKFDEKEHKD